jgi:hypothetical protein
MIILKCDKDENFKSQEFEKRETSTRVCEYSFEIIATFESKSKNQNLKVKNDNHNHELIMRKVHSIHRRLIMISKVQQQIVIQTRTKTTSRQICSICR